jgi:hypothetical protein
MDDMQSRLEELKQFVSARERLAEGRGTDWPLAGRHMPNLSREADRTTKLVFAKYDKITQDHSLLYPVLVRATNYWPFIKQLDFDEPLTDDLCFDIGSFIDVVASEGGCCFSKTSYIKMRFEDSGSRLNDFVLKPMMNNPNYFISHFRVASPWDIYGFVRNFKSIGDLTATEIVKDLMYIRHKMTGDSLTFNHGPVTDYSAAAVNYLAGRKDAIIIPKTIYNAELDKLNILLGNADDRYLMYRTLHLFGKHIVHPAPKFMNYMPNRAEVEQLPSFRLFQEELC